MYISSKSLLQILTVDAIITESIGYTHHCICHVVKQDIGPWLWVQQKSHITEISQLYNILCTTLCTLEVSDINLCSPSFEARLSDAFLFFDHAPYPNWKCGQSSNKWCRAVTISDISLTAHIIPVLSILHVEFKKLPKFYFNKTRS